MTPTPTWTPPDTIRSDSAFQDQDLPVRTLILPTIIPAPLQNDNTSDNFILRVSLQACAFEDNAAVLHKIVTITM